MAKTIIAGSRTVKDMSLVEEAIRESGFTVTQVVCGCADGVDSLGAEWAKQRGIPVKYFPADWKNQGRSAGPRRNKQMAEYAKCLIAIWKGRSPGTRDMIVQATSRGLNIYVKKI